MIILIKKLKELKEIEDIIVGIKNINLSIE